MNPNPPDLPRERLDDLFARLKPALSVMIDRIKVFIEEIHPAPKAQPPAE